MWEFLDIIIYNLSCMNVSKKIEAILFFKGEPVSIKKLADLLFTDIEHIEVAISKLEDVLSDRGIRIMRKDNSVALATAPEYSKEIEKMLKEELDKNLGKAGTETLSIVLYLGPISRSRIDYIRGVNSNFILRNLMIRGLIEKITNPDDKRAYLYKPTFELLSYLGVADIKDVPEYESIRKQIEAFENEHTD